MFSPVYATAGFPAVSNAITPVPRLSRYNDTSRTNRCERTEASA